MIVVVINLSSQRWQELQSCKKKKLGSEFKMTKKIYIRIPKRTKKKGMEMRGIEPRASRMQSERSTV